GRKSRRCS
ncbi:Bifunctional aspartokinase/homoserine dehydrogenase 1, partial [Haemophilus influenzae]